MTRLRYLLAIVPVGLAGAFVLGVTGHPTHTVFSNISNGLGGGTGGGAAALPAGPTPQLARPNVVDGSSAPATGGPQAASVGNAADQLKLQLGKPSGQIERSVKAAFTVEPGHFMNAMQSTLAKTIQLNGYVVSTDTSPDDQHRIVSGTLVLRVPADSLTTLVAGLARDWQTASINFATVDHTAEFVDVTAHIAQATAQRDALLKALAAATTSSDIASLQQQISALQQQLDQAQGQLKVITEQVSYSTATIQLSERGGQVATAPPPPAPISGAWHNGLDNAAQVVAFGVAAVISALPVGVLLVVLYFTGVRPLARRSGLMARRTAAPEVPAAG